MPALSKAASRLPLRATSTLSLRVWVAPPAIVRWTITQR